MCPTIDEQTRGCCKSTLLLFCSILPFRSRSKADSLRKIVPVPLCQSRFVCVHKPIFEETNDPSVSQNFRNRVIWQPPNGRAFLILCQQMAFSSSRWKMNLLARREDERVKKGYMTWSDSSALFWLILLLLLRKKWSSNFVGSSMCSKIHCTWCGFLEQKRFIFQMLSGYY